MSEDTPSEVDVVELWDTIKVAKQPNSPLVVLIHGEHADDLAKELQEKVPDILYLPNMSSMHSIIRRTLKIATANNKSVIITAETENFAGDADYSFINTVIEY